jgi:hypothetical protein
MQAFYTRLFAASSDKTGYWGWLARLTRLSLARAASLKSELSWDVWQTGQS